MTTRTYVYALVRDSAAPALGGAPDGVSGAGPARALPAGAGLWLVVAGVPAAAYDEAAIAAGLEEVPWVSERALGHERVVEHLLAPAADGEPAARAVLPLKLFTLFDSDQRAVAWAAGEAPGLAARLDRVAGRVEMGARMSWTGGSPERADGSGPAARPVSGVEFLRAKRRRRDERRERAAAAAAAAEEAFDDLAGAAVEARRRPLPAAGGSVVLDAVFLVAAGEGVARFEACADAAARRLAAAGCELTLTGPWPPYHFAEEAG